MPYKRTGGGGGQPADQDLADIAAISGSNDDLIQKKSGAWTNRTPAQVKTDLALVKGDVGLGNVDNTSDANKPVSTATQTALDGKQTLDSDLTTIAGLTATTDNFLQAKSSAWASRTVAQVKTDLAISNVDNTSDANKPVSTATQTALDAKQPLDSDLTTIAGLTATTDSFLQAKSSAWAARTVAQVKTDLGITNETFREQDFWAAVGASFNPIVANVGSVNPTSQSIYGQAVYLYNGETVTNVMCCVAVAGSGTAPSGLKLGLWSSAATPVCLAVTAELKDDSRWTSTGWKVNALSTPYPVVSSGIYYLAWWMNGSFASTNVSVSTGSTNTGFANQIGSGARMACSLKTSATSMAAADTGTFAAIGSVPLMGWS